MTRAAAAAEALGFAPGAPDEGPVTGAVVRAALESASVAGDLQLASLEQLAATDVATKSSARDLVSRVDVASEQAIVERLRAAAPGYEIEAEEEVEDARTGAPRWFVDPLDGTVNYVHGIPLFSVSIALYAPAEEDAPPRPLLGVVHAPRLGETFVAARGRGAWLVGPGPAPPRRLSVRTPDGLGEAVVATGFPYRRGELANPNLENFGRVFFDVRGVRRLGSAALDLAFVAAGRLDGFWELHLSPFDVAAGAAIVLEAGGVVTDLDGGDDWLRGGHIAAGPGPVVSALRERVTRR